MLRALVLWLRPPGWPAVPPELRPRLRALALGAIAAQVLFVVAWVVAGALEGGYSATDSYVSELGAADVDHAWIVNAGIVVLGAGFACVAAGLAIVLRGRPWARVAPALFAGCAVLTVAGAAMTLDCGSSVDAACEARQDAGALSWHHYGHGWVSAVVPLLLVATPFALARAERPSRLARITFASGVAGFVLWLASLAGSGETHGPVGLYQRLGLAVIHYWVIVIAITLLIEASLPAGQAPRTSASASGVRT